MMIKKMCIISAYYPSTKDPHYAFVGNLVEQFADKGVECHVISPVSNVEKIHKAESRIEKTKNGAEIKVYCPHYTLFPSRNILGYETFRLTVKSVTRAIKNTFDKYIGSCDVIYSHFIEAGIYASFLKKHTDIPAFMAVGESELTKKKLAYTQFHERLYSGLDGVISVSTPLKNELLSENIISDELPILVAPNGVDLNVFRPLDKHECREKLGIQSDDFVISFVGGFIKRKGFDKIINILQRNAKWKCILIGRGEIPVALDKEQVIYSGRLPHDSIPEYICASDVFVLPTEAEGCCNAIIEAMACGLPIVSSDRDFNFDVLNRDCSILVNSENEAEIEDAIKQLYLDKYKSASMAGCSEINGRQFSIVNRANKILQFMESNR